MEKAWKGGGKHEGKFTMNLKKKKFSLAFFSPLSSRQTHQNRCLFFLHVYHPNFDFLPPPPSPLTLHIYQKKKAKNKNFENNRNISSSFKKESKKKKKNVKKISKTFFLLKPVCKKKILIL